MKRRPEQLSMLTLMGQPEDDLRIVAEEYDRAGNCTRLVTIGRDCPVKRWEPAWPEPDEELNGDEEAPWLVA